MQGLSFLPPKSKGNLGRNPKMPKPFSYCLEYRVVSRVCIIHPLYDSPLGTGNVVLLPSCFSDVW